MRPVFSEENPNLLELGTEIVRECYTAARRLKMYEPEHPTVASVCERPFFLFKKWFRLRQSLVLAQAGNSVSVSGIPLLAVVFTSNFSRAMGESKVSNFIFHDTLSPTELALFLSHLFGPQARRVPLKDYLQQKKVLSIEADTPAAKLVLETENSFSAAYRQDFSCRHMAKAVLKNRPELLTALVSGGLLRQKEMLEQWGIEFRLKVLEEGLFAVLEGMNDQMVLTLLETALPADFTSPQEVASKQQSFRFLVNAALKTREKDKFLIRLKSHLDSKRVPRPFYESALDVSSRLKLEITSELENLGQRILEGISAEELARYADLFIKCLKLRRPEVVGHNLASIADALVSPLAEARQGAYLTARKVLEPTVSSEPEQFLIFLRRLVGFVVEQKESLEFAETLLLISELCIEKKFYQPVGEMLGLLAGRLELEEPGKPMGSLLIRKVLDNLNRPEIIQKLISELDTEERGRAVWVRQILSAIGSLETAQALSEKMSHPSRFIRQNVLKILSNLGNNSLVVAATLLADPSNYKRKPEGSLEEESWYRLRNAIHILGNLRKDSAVPVLEMPAADSDFRLRKEAVKALEKLPGRRKLPLLKKLALDSSEEIRRMAFVAMSDSAGEEDLDFLFSRFDPASHDAIPVIYAVSIISGSRARDFLIGLLDPTTPLGRRLIDQTGGQTMPVKVAILKGLARIGDERSNVKIREVADSLSKTQKLLLTSNPLSDTAKILLSKMQK
ncbi:MAG: HEAT repeat domain-containing protein [candidate division Zixibacteria bacterium]|nr:HEAT repeat domain-containing protein [candidate division Zixibacteria bacterium]